MEVLTPLLAVWGPSRPRAWSEARTDYYRLWLLLDAISERFHNRVTVYIVDLVSHVRQIAGRNRRAELFELPPQPRQFFRVQTPRRLPARYALQCLANLIDFTRRLPGWPAHLCAAVRYGHGKTVVD